PIYQRPKPAPPASKPVTQQQPKFTEAEKQSKKLLWDDEWFHMHKGDNVVVVFNDGERLEGVLHKPRTYTFVLDPAGEAHGSILVSKQSVKYIIQRTPALKANPEGK